MSPVVRTVYHWQTGILDAKRGWGKWGQLFLYPLQLSSDQTNRFFTAGGRFAAVAFQYTKCKTGVSTGTELCTPAELLSVRSDESTEWGGGSWGSCFSVPDRMHTEKNKN
jgi:hypothetical protein